MILLQLMLGFTVPLIIVMATMPKVIPILHKLKFGQVEREEGLASHKAKGGTPTMGGAVFILAALSVYALNINYLLNPYVNLFSFVLLGYGLIGFIDDYLIVVRHNNEGLKPLYKYVLQSALAIGFYFLAKKFLPHFSTEIILPISNIKINLGILYPVLVYFMFTSESNAVNLTDGLDGLATGLVIVAMAPFTIFALSQGLYPVAVASAALLGALAGFLYFNYNPARIFMGDCGSLALGAVLAALAVFTKQELLLLIIGAVPLIETLSVIIQVVSFKTRGKRVFKMAPLHHHFEMIGWSELKVVTLFWGIGFIAGIIGILLGVF